MKPVIIIVIVVFVVLALAMIVYSYTYYTQFDERISDTSESIDEPMRYSDIEIENAIDLVSRFKGNDNTGDTLNQSFYHLMNSMNNQNITEEDYYKYGDWQGGTFTPSSYEIPVLFVWEKPNQDLTATFVVHPDGKIVGLGELSQNMLAILENDSNKVQNTDDRINPEVFCTEKTKSLYYGLLDLAELYDEMEEKYCNNED